MIHCRAPPTCMCSGDRRMCVWDLGRIGDEQSAEDMQDGPPELLVRRLHFFFMIISFFYPIFVKKKKHSTSAKVMWVGGASSEHNHCISSGGIAMEIITLVSLIPLCWNCTAFHSSSMEDTRTRSVIFRGTQRRSGRWLLSQRTTFCKFGQWYGSMLSVA